MYYKTRVQLTSTLWATVMSERFSQRIQHVPPSFLREIFKVIADERIISFAGGLPNPDLFPVKEFENAAQYVLKHNGARALQYGATDGLPELRELIAYSYSSKDDVHVHRDNVIITNGSQQALDLLGKVLLNEKDIIGVEKPTYLAAIQALSLYTTHMRGITVDEDGMRTDGLATLLAAEPLKMLYTIPNFQNPSGRTYSNDVRRRVAEILAPTNTLLIEDDPYGEIRFSGERQKPFSAFTDNVVLLGSFSKIVAPGLRLGWMVVRDKELYDKLLIAKQASDLHTSTFVQHVVYQYYQHNDPETHVARIAQAYRVQKDTMVSALTDAFGDDVAFTNPDGGMFIWATFPESVRTDELFTHAVREGVAFVPGESFFTGDDVPHNTMRLNYTNASSAQITEGITRLKRAYDTYLSER